MSKMRKEYDPNKVKRRKRKPIVYIICEGNVRFYMLFGFPPASGRESVPLVCPHYRL